MVMKKVWMKIGDEIQTREEEGGNDLLDLNSHRHF